MASPEEIAPQEPVADLALNEALGRFFSHFAITIIMVAKYHRVGSMTIINSHWFKTYRIHHSGSDSDSRSFFPTCSDSDSRAFFPTCSGLRRVACKQPIDEVAFCQS